MPRLLFVIFVAVVATSYADRAWSQFAQAGADTFGTAGANTYSTAGPSGAPGTAVPQQTTPFYSGGVPAFNAPRPGAAFTGGLLQPFGTNSFDPANSFVFASPAPWFSSPAVRQQLQLNAIQYHHLYSAYVDAYTQYNQAVAELPATMLLAERLGRLQALEELYYGNFNETLEATVTNPELRQSFETLRAQYQNRPASNAPLAQPALNLTPEQHRRLSLMAYQWNQLAEQIRERAKQAEVPAEEVSELNEEAEKQITSTLTPEQQTIWPQLVGQYYDLDAPAGSPQSPAETEPQAAPAE